MSSSVSLLFISSIDSRAHVQSVEVVWFHLTTASGVGWRGLAFMCACVLTERACRVLHTCLNEGHHILGTPAGIYYWNNTFLCLLYVLHCFWFVTIVRMLVRFIVVGQVTTALRSSLWLCCLPRLVSGPGALRRTGSARSLCQSASWLARLLLEHASLHRTPTLIPPPSTPL